MFELIFIIALSVYFFQTVIFLIGAGKKFKRLDEKDLPSVSIIVAARNEENNILKCMESLNQLIYPENKIEIIIVDDNSTDTTATIIDEFISDKPKFIKINPSKNFGEVKGKANALANAIELSKGEIIMTTDADCSVSPTWAKTIASYYTKDVALVCGYTNQFERTIFQGMQSVDFIYLLGIAGGTMNLGKPLSCIGNNMSYRKSVYNEIGGYAKIPFSVTEDFKVLMAMHELKKYKIIYPLDEGGLVTSEPCGDVKSLYHQKKRWGVGGLDSDLAGYFVMSSGFVTHICVLLLPFFFSFAGLYLLSFKLFIDYFFLKSIYNRLKIKLLIKHFMAFEIYFIVYVLLLPITLILSRKVKWKGRNY